MKQSIRRLCLIGGAMTALILVATAGQPDNADSKSKDAPDKDSLHAMREADGRPDHREPAEFIIPEQFRDIAFERFIDLNVLQQSLGAQDVEQLCDLTFQLMEGERVLRRPHKAFPVKRLLEVTLHLAGAKKENSVLERLRKYAIESQNQELARAIDTVRGRMPRDDDTPSVKVDAASVANAELYRQYTSQIRLAVATNDRERVKELLEEIKNSDLSDDNLRQHLIKVAKDENAQAPPGVRGEGETDALVMLASNARGHNRAEREQALRTKFRNNIIFGGEYSVVTAALTAIDVYATGGGASMAFWKNEARRFGADGVGLLARAGFNPSRDVLYSGVMVFGNWHDQRYPCPTFRNPGRMCNARVTLPNKFVPWFAVRKG